MTSAPAASAYGKIPTHGDFVRVRAADPVARALALWLEDGSEAAMRAGGGNDFEPVRFLFQPAGAGRALVGVIVGSQDKVGRCFPLTIFARLDGAALRDAFPALPRAAASFLDEATALAGEAHRLVVPELAASVERLSPPVEADVAAAAAEASTAASAESGRDLLERLFGDPSAGQSLYALHCFRCACQVARGKEPGRAAAVLECPVRTAADRWTWLELARRGLAWRSPPSFFWRERSESHLLLSLGPVPAAVFGALWGTRDGRLWPLVTDKDSAIEAAREALGAAVVSALSRPISLRDLLDLVMPAASPSGSGTA